MEAPRAANRIPSAATRARSRTDTLGDVGHATVCDVQSWMRDITLLDLEAGAAKA
jgi:hypothetical protein